VYLSEIFVGWFDKPVHNSAFSSMTTKMKMAFDKSNLLFVLMTVATVKVWEFTSL